MNNNLEKFINSAKKIKLTTSEKLIMRTRLISKPSPFVFLSKLQHLNRLVFVAVIIVLIGGSISLATKKQQITTNKAVAPETELIGLENYLNSINLEDLDTLI